MDTDNPLYSKAPQTFFVDTTEAGVAPLDVTVEAPNKKIHKPEKVVEESPGIYAITYIPNEEGTCLFYEDYIGVYVLYQGVLIISVHQ